MAAQRDRWILWLSVAMTAGAALWLTAARDPPLWAGPAALAAGLICAIALALWPSPSPSGVAVLTRRIAAGLFALAAAAGLGASAAQVRAFSVAQPTLAASDAPIAVEGWVAEVDASERGPRLRLLVRAIEGAAAAPRYVRFSTPAAGLLTPGRAARCYGVLGPPAAPLSPGGYDFARRAYFEQLGATGFAYGRCRPITLPPPRDFLDRQMLLLGALRADLSASIQAAAPGRGGAIAAALVTGDRSSIDEATNDALWASGLGHLLSVSGVHMGVVGGLVFVALIWLFSLIAPIALRWPVKKLAAAGALIALALYLVVSGSSVPALRAFIMAGVAFGAILLDRPAISMRGLALAAAIVVLVFPESVVEPGFQMSFAATTALVALFEVLRRAPHETELPAPGPLIGALQWSARAIGATILISFVAGLASDPFAIYHFQRFSIYALAANIAVAPIMSFMVAPAAALAAVLAPFGLAGPALEAMAAALDLVVAIGEAFGARPEAVRALPRPSDLAFLLCVAALLSACLWRDAMRWTGAPLFAAALALYAFEPRPSVVFDSGLRALLARAAEPSGPRWVLVSRAGRSSFARDRLGASVGLAPLQIERLAPPETCGEAMCAWRSAKTGRTFVLTQDWQQACTPGVVVISSVPAPAGFAEECAPALALDAEMLQRRGGAAITELRNGAIQVRWAYHDVSRAWSRAAQE
ncbi:MAG: ComEC/Rec2 family competence protein [Hyphomonadaceae bacterium]